MIVTKFYTGIESGLLHREVGQRSGGTRRHIFDLNDQNDLGSFARNRIGAVQGVMVTHAFESFVEDL